MDLPIKNDAALARGAVQESLFPALVGSYTIARPKKKTRSYAGRKLVGRIMLFSGGVGSTTTMLKIFAGELPKPDLVVMSDTGKESNRTLATAMAIKEMAYGLGIQVIIEPPMPELHQVGVELDIWKDVGATLPVRAAPPVFVRSAEGSTGAMSRVCTSSIKIRTHDYVIKKWLMVKGYAPVPKGYSFKHGALWQNGELIHWRSWPRINIPRDICTEMWLGYTLDELSRGNALMNAWQKPAYPLIELRMKRDDCLRYIEEIGVVHPGKSACVMCPYRSDKAWLAMAKKDPRGFAEAVDYDHFLRTPEAKKAGGAFAKVRGEMFLHRSCRPLDEIDFEGIADNKRGDAAMFEFEMLMDCRSDGGFSCMT